MKGDAPVAAIPTRLHSGRLFICDPVCAQPFGHNVTQLRYFRDALQHRYSEVFPVCSKRLPSEVVAQNGFVPLYDFYYQRYIPLPATEERTSTASASSVGQFVDREEQLATADAARLLNQFRIGEHDSLMFPSVDFYGLIGLLNVLLGRKSSGGPRLLLRFIGVMETATPTYDDPLSELIQRVRDARDGGVRMEISAETPRLADRLADLLQDPVSVAPYPDNSSFVETPGAGPFVFYCPGSARIDKGFMHLLQICRAVRERDPELSIRFVTQVLPYRESLDAQGYISQLYAVPGVELLEPTISVDEMLENYRKCSAILLPYDAVNYKYRGSAVLMESACIGRPVIALDGPAFIEQIRYYGLGTVVPTVEAMIDEALRLAKRPRSELIARARQARYRFVADVDSGFRSWMGPCA